MSYFYVISASCWAQRHPDKESAMIEAKKHVQRYSEDMVVVEATELGTFQHVSPIWIENPLLDQKLNVDKMFDSLNPTGAGSVAGQSTDEIPF